MPGFHSERDGLLTLVTAAVALMVLAAILVGLPELPGRAPPPVAPRPNQKQAAAGSTILFLPPLADLGPEVPAGSIAASRLLIPGALPTLPPTGGWSFRPLSAPPAPIAPGARSVPLEPEPWR